MTFSTGLRRTTAVAVTIVGLTLAAAAVPFETAQSGAATWVQSLSRSHRLEYARTDRAAGLPVEYRKAVFKALSTPDEQAAFWRGVFAAYRQAHQLSPDQSATLARAEALLSPATFSSSLSGLPSNSVAEVRDAVAAALGSDAARELFVTGGPLRQSSSSLPFAERIRYTLRTHRPAGLTALAGKMVPFLQASSCNCASTEDCSYSQGCGRSPYSCSRTSWGCGSWWMDECTDLCSYDREE